MTGSAATLWFQALPHIQQGDDDHDDVDEDDDEQDEHGDNVHHCVMCHVNCYDTVTQRRSLGEE